MMVDEIVVYNSGDLEVEFRRSRGFYYRYDTEISADFRVWQVHFTLRFQ